MWIPSKYHLFKGFLLDENIKWLTRGCIPVCVLLQGSHSHGKSGKVMEKFVVMESHGKVMENNKNIKSHGKVKILA